MKPIRLFLFSLLASALVAGASIPLRGDTLSHGISPDPSLNLPAVKQIALPNGISAYYIRDDLPVLTLTAAVGYGSLYEDIKTAGTASLLAKTLSLAGSKKYPGPALYEAVESLGGKLSVSSSWEQTTISVTVLARHAEKAFDIVSSIVSEPNLDEKYINDARALIIEGIRRKQDQAQLVAFDKLRELIFNGKGYGATETEGSVRAIRREDLAAVTARCFNGGNTLVGISASLPENEVRALASKYFSTIAKGSRQEYRVSREEALSSVREKAGKIFLIVREIPQATITMGTVAPPIRDESIFPLALMNYILGEGSFNSRLMKEIRVKRGLSYSVASVLRPRRETGAFLAYAQTKTEMADRTTAIMFDTIRSMAEKPVSGEDMKWANESIANSYIFEFDTSLHVLEKYLFLHYNGLDESYLRTFLGRIRAVRADQIVESAKTLLGSGLVTVVVGDRSLRDRLSKFGEVKVIE